MKINKIFIDQTTTIYYSFYDENSDVDICNIALNERDKKKLSEISSPARRREIIATRRLFNNIFEDDELLYSGLGAPYLKSEKFEISISHSNYLVAVMVSDKRCGVDLEDVNRGFANVAHRFLPELIDEKLESKRLFENRVSQLDLAAAWTTKEATFKAFRGENIDIFKDIKISIINEEEVVCSAKGELIRAKIIKIESTIFAAVIREW